MQHVCTILSSVTCPAVQYFFTISHKCQDFRKKVIEHKKCVLIFCTNFVRKISHSKKNCARCDEKIYTVLRSCPILMKSNFSLQFF